MLTFDPNLLYLRKRGHGRAVDYHPGSHQNHKTLYSARKR